MRQPSLHHRSVARSVVTAALSAAVFVLGIAPALAATTIDFTQQAAKNSIVVGQQAQFTYVISNTGQEFAIFPQMHGALPGGGNIEWMTTTPGCGVYGEPASQTLECDFNYLTPGHFQFAEVHGVVNECTVLESLVTVAGDNFATKTEVDLIVVACPLAGQMTGAGNLVADGVALTHDFALQCDVADSRQNLDINWSSAKGNGKRKVNTNAFHLSALTTAECINDPMIVPSPTAGFNTFVGGGFGTCNGKYAEVSFVFTDGGTAGAKGTAEYQISGGCTLDAAETAVISGSQQARKD